MGLDHALRVVGIVRVLSTTAAAADAAAAVGVVERNFLVENHGGISWSAVHVYPV